MTTIITLKYQRHLQSKLNQDHNQSVFLWHPHTCTTCSTNLAVHHSPPPPFQFFLIVIIGEGEGDGDAFYNPMGFCLRILFKLWSGYIVVKVHSYFLKKIDDLVYLESTVLVHWFHQSFSITQMKIDDDKFKICKFLIHC